MSSASFPKSAKAPPVYLKVTQVRQYDDYALKERINSESIQRQELERQHFTLQTDHKELTEETTQHLQALSDKYEVLEAAVFGSGGLQEQILTLKREVQRLSAPAPLISPAVPRAVASLRQVAADPDDDDVLCLFTATAPSPSPSGDTAEPK